MKSASVRGIRWVVQARQDHVRGRIRDSVRRGYAAATYPPSGNFTFQAFVKDSEPEPLGPPPHRPSNSTSSSAPLRPPSGTVVDIIRKRTQTPGYNSRSGTPGSSSGPPPAGSGGGGSGGTGNSDVVPKWKRHSFEELKYYKLYPPRIKGWIFDCKTPKGVWANDGTWKVTQPLYAEAIIETAAETEAQAREREIQLGSKVLPPDLVDRYRFDVTEEDLAALQLPPTQLDKMRNLLSFKYAGRAEINKFRIAELRKKWGRKPNDTGSSEVQVAVLTEKIRYMTDHLKNNHKDQRTKRALGITIDMRRALLKHLKKQNVATYFSLLRSLNLRDTVLV